MKTKNLVICALFAAIICIVSPFYIPVGAVPVSLGLFAVALTAFTTGSKMSVIATGIYLTLGFVGIGVFAGFKGGVGILMSPTGGFLISYVLVAAILGCCRGGIKRDFLLQLVALFVCYLIGTVWYLVVTKSSILTGLVVCVLPFVVFDIIKLTGAYMIAKTIKRELAQGADAMDFFKRKPTRLKGFDYSQNGAYFITICTKNRKQILSEIGSCLAQNKKIIVGKAALCLPQNKLTYYGAVTEKYILNINNVYKSVFVDKYVIMPNHIHMIVVIDKNGRQEAACPTLSDIVRSVKIMVRKETGESLFQSSFHDHIIRNAHDYEKIWEYIDTNPLKWEEDCFYDNEKTDLY